jgi:hypothetical protein
MIIIKPTFNMVSKANKFVRVYPMVEKLGGLEKFWQELKRRKVMTDLPCRA